MMSHQPFYRESEESWAERQRRIILAPGQEVCECGEVIEPDERHKCANCGQEGCVHCMRWVDDTEDPQLEGDWVCGDDCEIEWLRFLAQSEQRLHVLYQDWIAKRIQAVRLRKAG